MDTIKEAFDIITHFGDNGFLVAMIAVSSIYLLMNGARKTAAYVVIGPVCVAAAVLVLKLLFIGCSQQQAMAVYSPSGHAAMAAIVLGSLAVVASLPLSGLSRLVPFAAVLPLIAGVSISRVVLGMHSLKEVVMGLVLGAIFCAGGFFLVGRDMPAPPKPKVFYVLVLGAGVLFFGVHVPVEGLIENAAALLDIDRKVCVALDRV